PDRAAAPERSLRVAAARAAVRRGIADPLELRLRELSPRVRARQGAHPRWRLLPDQPHPQVRGRRSRALMAGVPRAAAFEPGAVLRLSRAARARRAVVVARALPESRGRPRRDEADQGDPAPLARS